MQSSVEQDFARWRERCDARALGRVFDVLAPELAVVAGHVAGRASAEDLVQATFLQAIQHAQRWDGARPLLPWLVGILVRLALHERTQERRRIDPERLPHAPPPDPHEIAETEELANAIAQALRGLPLTYRHTLSLRLVHGLAPTAIAHALGEPVATVKSRLQRGMEMLRRALPSDLRVGALGVVVPRTLAQVRDAVLERAATHAAEIGAATTAVTGTKLGVAALMNKTMLAVGGGLLLVAATALAVSFAQEREAIEPHAVVASEAQALARESEPGRDDPEDAQASPSGRETVAAAITEDADEKGIVLAGRVLDVPQGDAVEQGRGAAGVQVRVRGAGGGGYALDNLGDPVGAKWETTSDPDGAFRIVLPEPSKRPVSLLLSAEESDRFRSAELKCEVKTGERGQSGLLLARRAHGALAGRAIDLAGRPVAGVEVEVLGWKESKSVPIGTSTSGDDGSFRIEYVRNPEKLDAHKEGFILVKANALRPLDAGGWEPCEVVLASQGTLSIQVHDPAGAPVSDVSAYVDVSPNERYGKESLFTSAVQFNAQGKTDAAGAVALEVCAEQHLRVLLSWPGTEGYAFSTRIERVDGDRMIAREGDAGSLLSVAPGERRDVRFEVAARLRISGRVTDDHGVAPPVAWVSVVDPEQPRIELGALRYVTRAAPDGSFALEICATEPLHRLLITASESDPDRVSFRGPQRGPSPRFAWAMRDFSRKKSGEEHLALVLQPTFAIAGRIVPPQRAELWVNAHASGDLPAVLFANRGASSNRETGEFRIDGLLPGTYDLEVANPWVGLRTWVRDVAAGTEDVRVQFAGDRPAHVTVEVELSPLANAELGETVVLIGAFRPHGARPDVAELAAAAVYREPFGWPPQMLSLWYGGGGFSDALGQTSCSLSVMKQNPTTSELGEGCYWIGVQARMKDGALVFPIGTGLVHVGAGEHHVRFEVAPGASLEGRVNGIPEGKDLRVALVFADGRLIPLNVRRDAMQPTCELGRDGSFQLALVPSGSCELRVGTKEELEDGRCVHREEIALAPGEHRVIEIEL